jgi:glutaconate CoA-transferase, subunit A
MAEVIALKEAVKMIPDGSMVFFGGSGLNRNPMAFCRELIRQNKKNLHLIGVFGGLAADMLTAAGAVSRVELAEFSLEDEMDALYLRQQVADCNIQAEIYSAYAMCLRLYGGASGVPFMPLRSMIGTDLRKPTFRGEGGKLMTVACPFTGEPVNLVPSINPDVGVVHVLKADIEGNVIIEGPLESDLDGLLASEIKLVTAEEVVEKLDFRLKGFYSWRVILPNFVIEAKFGAWPTAAPSAYLRDVGNLGLWHMEPYDKYFAKFIAPKESTIIKSLDGKKL